MSGIVLFWIILYLCATLLFFGTAAVITVFGIRDLKDLLNKTEARDRKQEARNR